MPPIDTGMRRIMSRLTEFAEKIPVDALMAGAEVVYQRSQELVPVDTGFLKKSGFIQQQGDDVQVGYDADYASFVEFGTSKMAAQPYLRPAIDNNEEEILNAVGSKIIDWMQDALAAGPGAGAISTQPNPFGTLQP
jgi:HK97 gp10 family phage protein